MIDATSHPRLAAAAVTLGCLALLLAAAPPRSTLHIVRAGRVIEWWRSDRAPTAWTQPLPVVADAFAWRPLQPGLDLAEAELTVNRRLLRLRVIAVRLDPARFRLQLTERTAANGMTGTWSLAEAPAVAALAVNAGQFAETGPWGWLVRDGREYRYPGRGPLALAVAIDSGGAVDWLPDAALARHRAERAPVTAFQSYPLLIHEHGNVPAALRRGRDLDRQHRDTRLAVGRLPDGRLLFVMTRFIGGGRLLERLPAGLTTPETAALLGALGARPALMLDGGLSAQLLVRDSTGGTLQWPGGRKVPLALIAIPHH